MGSNATNVSGTVSASIWARFVRDGWNVRAAAQRMKVSEEYASAEMARVRKRVQNSIISDAVARDLRSGWNPRAAIGLR